MRTAMVAGVLMAAAAVAASSMPAASAARPDKPKIVYLTFDDGPDDWNDPQLLRVLRRNDVPATFFVLGSAASADPGALRRLYLGGHAIGNHSYSHADLTHLSLAGVEHELAATERVLGPVGGACMRPPYGAVNPTVLAAARAQGLAVVMWTVDPEDWAHQNTDYLVNHILSHVRHRAVVLMHDGGGSRQATIQAVKRLVPQLRARGYEFRTVPSCRVPLRFKVEGMSKETRPVPSPTPTPTTSPVPTPPVVS